MIWNKQSKKKRNNKRKIQLPKKDAQKETIKLKFQIFEHLVDSFMLLGRWNWLCVAATAYISTQLELHVVK